MRLDTALVALLLAFATSSCASESAPDPRDTTETVPDRDGAPIATSTTLTHEGGSLAAESPIVRGLRVPVVAKGLPPGREVAVWLSDPNQRMIVAEGIPDSSGLLRVEMYVPDEGPHEGDCDVGPCEYRDVENPLVLSVRLARDPAGSVLASTEVRFTPAEQNVGYRVGVFNSCGPVRTMLDGVTWVAEDDSSLLPPGVEEMDMVLGTLTVRSPTRAGFVADDGRPIRRWRALLLLRRSLGSPPMLTQGNRR